MRKKDIINFAPTGVNRRKKTPVYVGLIVCACVLLLAASVALIIIAYDGDIGKAIGVRQPEETEEAENTSDSLSSGNTENNDITSNESYAFLVTCSDKSELLFAQLIYVKPSVSQIRIVPVSGNRMMKTENGDMTFSEAFRALSLSSLCSAFAADNIKVDRYVHVSAENYRILLSNLGAVNVYIEEYCEFNVDAIKHTFEPGVTEMTSDMLIKYLRYAGNEETEDRIRAMVTLSVFRQHFTKSNFEKGEGLFSSLINSVDSNITAFDYEAAKPILESMLSGAVEVTVVG